MSRDLHFVLKVAERCNINCTYCYYFNRGNTTPLTRPKAIGDDVVHGVLRFAEETANQIDLGQIKFVLQGGEPLMVGKAKVRSICETLSQLKETNPDTHIVMTTNGTLIDDEWVDIFSKFQIGICVSLDGPQEYNDRERVDFRGRGTYTRVVSGIQKLQRAAELGRIAPPAVLAVIDPRSRGDVVYHHLIRELGFRAADFLVPNNSHDISPSEDDILAVGDFLVDAFEEWVRDDDPSIHIRTFDKYMARILGIQADVDRNPTGIVAGICSDGTIINDDGMQQLGPHIFDRGLNVCRSTIAEYLYELTQGELAGLYEPHTECVECEWFDVCQPPKVPWLGAEMRYKRSTGFQNKLVHCEALQKLYRAMKSYVDESTILPAVDSQSARSYAQTRSVAPISD